MQKSIQLQECSAQMRHYYSYGVNMNLFSENILKHIKKNLNTYWILFASFDTAYEYSSFYQWWYYNWIIIFIQATTSWVDDNGDEDYIGLITDIVSIYKVRKGRYFLRFIYHYNSMILICRHYYIWYFYCINRSTFYFKFYAP